MKIECGRSWPQGVNMKTFSLAAMALVFATSALADHKTDYSTEAEREEQTRRTAELRTQPTNRGDREDKWFWWPTPNLSEDEILQEWDPSCACYRVVPGPQMTGGTDDNRDGPNNWTPVSAPIPPVRPWVSNPHTPTNYPAPPAPHYDSTGHIISGGGFSQTEGQEPGKQRGSIFPE